MRFFDVENSLDYYSFGMLMPERNGGANYRYGYQGSEKDNEVKGNGNSYTTYFRQLDPRLGRWLTIDPVTQPWQSPYTSMDNSPIRYNDPLGDKVKPMDKKSARRTKKILKQTFSGKEYRAARKLFKLNSDKSEFKPINEDKLFDVIDNMKSSEAKGLLYGYAQMINNDKNHFVIITKSNEKIFKNQEQINTIGGLFEGIIQFEDYYDKMLMNGQDIDNMAMGGITFNDERGNSLVIVNLNNTSKLTYIDQYQSINAEGKSVTKFTKVQKASSNGEIFAHELLGHALYSPNGQVIYSLMLSNMYLRHKGQTHKRVGFQHGVSKSGIGNNIKNGSADRIPTNLQP